MSGTTPLQALPYPTGTDTPAGHTEIQALAVAVDPKLVMVFSSASARASAVTSPTEGMLCWLNDLNRYEYYTGNTWARVGAAGDRIGCRIRRVANQPINSAASTPVNFDTQDEDTDGFFAPTSTTVTIPAGLGGVYDLTYRQTLNAGPTSRTFAELALTSSIPGNPTDFRFPGNGHRERPPRRRRPGPATRPRRLLRDQHLPDQRRRSATDRLAIAVPRIGLRRGRYPHMPVPQTVAPRMISLAYDGTNAADILAHLRTNQPITPTTYRTGTEADGVLTITTSDPNLWSDIVVPIGSHVIATPGNSAVVLPENLYTAWYVVL
jgi:hypothetical protein